MSRNRAGINLFLERKLRAIFYKKNHEKIFKIKEVRNFGIFREILGFFYYKKFQKMGKQFFMIFDKDYFIIFR